MEYQQICQPRTEYPSGNETTDCIQRLGLLGVISLCTDLPTEERRSSSIFATWVVQIDTPRTSAKKAFQNTHILYCSEPLALHCYGRNW